MAQYRRCATSPLTTKKVQDYLLGILILHAYSPFSPFVEAGLYSESDQIILLKPDTVESTLFNSSAALLVEFYASWCGHCIAFSPVWKSLARDTREWKPAVDLAAIDCADEENLRTCITFGIRGFPTVKFFHPYSAKDSRGVSFPVYMRDVGDLRRQMIDMIEIHKDHWPPACPPLEAASKAEIDSFFETSSVQHLVLVFEKASSYVGREVILDLLQFENITVRRVLDTEEELVSKLGVTEFPSCYLYHKAGNFSRLRVHFEVRSFYSYALQRLPDVVRTGKSKPIAFDLIRNETEHPWREFNRTRVYMSDLESALHFSLRVELASHLTISGEALTALRRYISVLAKYFPGRLVVRNLLQATDSWMKSQGDSELQYKSLLAVLDNAEQDVPNAVLPHSERWVGCQGSQSHFRRYPCSMWTLFHVLTVEANSAPASGPQEVLRAMRAYIRSFFGCRECATHFEHMARESMDQVKTPSAAVLWLWFHHNQVNNRLAGAPSEDPHFPKVQWPPPELCPTCHAVSNGEHTWVEKSVLSFLMDYYSSSNILHEYLEPEAELLQKQGEQQEAKMEKQVSRASQDTRGQEEPASERDGGVEEGQESDQEPGLDRPGGEGGQDASTSEPPRPQRQLRGEQEVEHGPTIVGLRPREPRGDIVDLDSFVDHHYKAEALRIVGRAKRALQRRQLSHDLALQPVEPDDLSMSWTQFQKRGLAGQYMGLEGEGGPLAGGPQQPFSPWISGLVLGFSRLDVSLCALLYGLSSLCLLAMYRCARMRVRLHRSKVALP